MLGCMEEGIKKKHSGRKIITDKIETKNNLGQNKLFFLTSVQDLMLPVGKAVKIGRVVINALVKERHQEK